MSDELDQAAESADTGEQGSPTGSTEAPTPWGEDFNAERAWQTISHLRGREKELESDSKLLKQLREDEGARREFLSREFGYEFEADDEDEDDDLDTGVQPQHDPRVDQLQNQLQQVLSRQANKDFEEDLDAAAGEAKMKLTARERRFVKAESVANGFNADATRKALKEVLEDREALRGQFLEEYRGSKRAPHVSSVGKSASQKPNLDDPSERAAYIDEMMAE